MNMATTLDVLKNIHETACLSKAQHFNAAERCDKLNCWLSIPVIIINIILGSVFFVALNKELPEVTKWVGASFALTAAVCSGLHAFFSFNQLLDGHRSIANRYHVIIQECERALALFADKHLNENELVKYLENIQNKHKNIYNDAIKYPTRNRDYKKAIKNINNNTVKQNAAYCRSSDRSTSK